LLNYHHAVAAGGIAMTTVAYAAMDRSGLSFPHQLWLQDKAIPGLIKLTDAVHKEGADCFIAPVSSSFYHWNYKQENEPCQTGGVKKNYIYV
jgi:2,4-dienoyl-CoA reductase-like NADH-dependent reductase (Old Yellow Enzyme family)